MISSTARRIVIGLGAASALALTGVGTASANGYARVDSLTVTRTTSTTAVISWKGTDYAGPNRYRISWHERQSPGRTWTSSGSDYSIKSSPLTLTGLLPGRVYDVTVAARTADGWFGSSSHSVAITAGPRVKTTPSTCVLDNVVSMTNADIVRTLTGLRVTGSLSYVAADGLHAEPTSDYRLTLEKQIGSSWTPVTSIAPNQPTNVSAGAGTYRLVFGGECSMPYGSSVSDAVTR